ncbi:hypothetical protein [Tenacibaculum sp. 190524A02b]|uniref:hypothetical protein n=1 Tax=Tenacibaculum vairaonense TaxID=3137860 RepID=UPI0031FAAF5D
MHQVLIDYNKVLEIPKWSKKERHLGFQNWFNFEYKSLPSYTELKDYLNKENNNIRSWDTHFFKQKVIFPVYEKEIYNNRNIEAIKFILENYQNHFFEFTKHQKVDLLEMGLQIDDNDIELLTYKFKTQLRYFEYTIHEVPRGVLYDNNGANIEQTKENLLKLNDFESLAEQLNEDIKLFMKNCRFYYETWISFLEDENFDSNFEQFLKRKENKD